MLLTIDIGNTNINLGIFNGDTLTMSARIATDRQKTNDQYAVDFVNIFSVYNIKVSDIEGTVISSVVPEITIHIKNAVKRLTDKKVVVLGPGVKTGLNILIDNPAQLGADLAAGAVGAMSEYTLPAFIVDLGTATKICAIDENRNFRGCMIAPGIAISLKALTDTSSLLPAIPLDPPKKACGTNTIESMQSGIVLGTASMIDGLLDRFADELGEPATIIATGGLSNFIAPVCKREMALDQDLILKGLKAIYEKNK
ncbi:MAG: type III pantothenate kinase [Clostridia bacterium]|nr:type III pantothenate kinase [Clostridia bacterium]